MMTSHENDLVISMCRELYSNNFSSKQQNSNYDRIFLLLYGRHVCVLPRGTNMVSPYKSSINFGETYPKQRANEKQHRPQTWRGGLYDNHLSYTYIVLS